MEPRPRPVTSQPQGSLNQNHTNNQDPGSLSYLAQFLEYGHITLGHMSPVGDVAIASEGQRTYIMLKRQQNETLNRTLHRLDQAIAKIIHEGIFTDEINPLR